MLSFSFRLLIFLVAVFSFIDISYANEIEFAGREWTIKDAYCSVGNTAGPGPNYWCGQGEDIWVDAQDRLHMRINYKESLSSYACVSIKTPVSGCGTYRYSVVNGPGDSPDGFDDEVVLGLFTYDSDSPSYDYYEIDIEVTGGEPNLYYVTWEDQQSAYDDFNVSFGEGTVIHSFIWQPSAIIYNSTKDNVLIGNGVRTEYDTRDGYSVYPCPYKPTDARINLWLTSGNPPDSEQEVIIENFEFIPFVILNSPSNFTAEALSSSSIKLEWTDMSAAESGIEIERKEYGGEYSLVDTLDPDVTEYEDTGLDGETTYVYRIRSIGSYEDGPWSSEAEETTIGMPSLSSINFSFAGWYGYVEGTIQNIPYGTFHARSWVKTNKMYREGKDLDVDVNGYFYADYGLWGTPGPDTFIYVTLHYAETDVYGTGDSVTMELEYWPDQASPDWIFGPFVTQ